MVKGLDDCTYKRERRRSSSDHFYKMERRTLTFVILTLIQGKICYGWWICDLIKVYLFQLCYQMILFFSSALASDAVEIKPSMNPAVAGDTLTLSLSSSLSFKSGSWAIGESQILTWLGEQQAVFPSHSGRASVNVLTGALTLSPIKVTDSGVYIVQSTDPELKANISITVLGETQIH